MKKKLLFFSFFLILFSAKAQNAGEEAGTAKIKKNAISLNLGFPGIGLGYARSISDHFSARFKVSFMEQSIDKNEIVLSDREVNANGDYKANTYDLWMDYIPFKSSSFKLVGGLTYLAKFKASAVLTPSGSFQYGDIVLSEDQIGDIQTSADWSGKLVPYLGLGFGRAIPKHNFGIGIEFGGYFIGEPDFSYDGSKMLAPNTQKEEESHEIEDWVDQFKVMGNIAVHLSYKF